MPSVLNVRTCKCFTGMVYVGRGTKWGNPYRIGVHGNRLEVLRAYSVYLRSRLDLLPAIRVLRGLNLLCHCAPLDCHADLLVYLANASDEDKLAWWQQS